MDQRAAEACLLLHAAGKFARGTVGEGRHAGSCQKIGNTPLAFFPVMSKQPSEKIDIFEHRKRRIKVLPKPLWHIGDARIGGLKMPLIGNIAVQDLDMALLHRPGPGDQR